MLTKLMETYGNEESLETMIGDKDFSGMTGPVASFHFDNSLGYIVWRNDCTKMLEKLYDRAPSFAEKLIQFVVRHEKGHASSHYEPQAELSAVSKYEDPLEGVILGLSFRLYYAAKKFMKAGETLETRKDKVPLVLDKYCPWLREDLKDVVVQKALDLVELYK